ncbi:pyridoxamine 5'-phosphate oxidase family protein, partial [[Clostridium] symbiosum]|nr:pyridoxamine 5'-phosphate oxidase family protein [[Clostridium] symbiosum]
VGKNLGWVLEPQNTEIRKKLRSAFADWYDMANNENDENCKTILRSDTSFCLIHLDTSCLRISGAF